MATDKPAPARSTPVPTGPALPPIGPGADLVDADLRGASLAGADLRDADLSGADLSGADLRSVVLDRARLDGSVLAGASLDGASLRDAVLDGAVLERAYGSAADLTGASLRGADLRYAGLGTARLMGADLTGADMAGVSLGGADLTGTHLADANMTAAQLDGTNLSEADLSRADLTGVQAAFADLSGADLTEADLTEARLAGSDLTDAVMTGTTLRRTELSGSVGVTDEMLIAALRVTERQLPRELLDREIRLDSEDAIRSAAGEACSMGGRVEGARPYEGRRGFHPLVIVGVDGPIETLDWLPAGRRHTELVACFDEDRRRTVGCGLYRSSLGGVTTLSRIWLEWRVTVRDGADGDVRARRTPQGRAPRCRESSTGNFVGRPAWGPVVTFLEAFVEGRRTR